MRWNTTSRSREEHACFVVQNCCMASVVLQVQTMDLWTELLSSYRVEEYHFHSRQVTSTRGWEALALIRWCKSICQIGILFEYLYVQWKCRYKCRGEPTSDQSWLEFICVFTILVIKIMQKGNQWPPMCCREFTFLGHRSASCSLLNEN